MTLMKDEGLVSTADTVESGKLSMSLLCRTDILGTAKLDSPKEEIASIIPAIPSGGQTTLLAISVGVPTGRSKDASCDIGCLVRNKDWVFGVRVVRCSS
jgi:hypothetical protein